MTEGEAQQIDLMRAAIEVRVFVEAVHVSLKGLIALPEAAPVHKKLLGLIGMADVALASARELEALIDSARSAG